jgi:PAS domain-containing protein
MKAYDIEIILSRQLAEALSIPVFIIDPEGTLLFYNEPAEKILGKKYKDTGEMQVDVWSTIFNPLDEEGNPLNPDDLPLVKTLKTRFPAHGSFWIKSLKNKNYRISVTSYPLQGRAERFLGAVAIFWKST